MSDETEEEYIRRKVDAYEMSQRVLRSGDGKELWLVTTGGFGHAIVASEPRVAVACGWHPGRCRVIDRRPRLICPSCAEQVGIVLEDGTRRAVDAAQ
jgi:hypothetical protein